MSKNNEDIGFNDTIKVGKRKLHIETSMIPEPACIVSSIFDGGELVDKQEMSLDEDITEKELKEEIGQFHTFIISDLELLFLVATKVKETKSAASIYKLGLLFFEKNFYSEALEQFQLALKLDETIENGYYMLGQTFFKARQYKKAMENLQKAVEKTPDYPDVHLLLGKTYWYLEEYAKAIQALEKALELNSEYHQACYTLGLYLIQSKFKIPKGKTLKPPIERLKDAQKYLKKAASLSAEYDDKLMEAGFEKLELKGEDDSGLQEFKQAYKPYKIHRKTILANAEFYLKFMFAGLDKDKKSLDHYITNLESSVKRHPNYPDLHKSLGTAYMIKSWHLFAKAVEEYRKAVQINSSFQVAQKNLKLLENETKGLLILLKAILE
jgi:tetratricopeptide (TPR) repeat protein